MRNMKKLQTAAAILLFPACTILLLLGWVMMCTGEKEAREHADSNN